MGATIMQRIVIENFGSVDSFNAVLNEKMTILIGSQATGKSTISKLVFYCRSLKDDLYKYLLSKEKFMDISENECFINFLKDLRHKFVGYFGTTKHMRNFEVRYYYDFINESEYHKNIKITLKSGYANVKFSDDLMNGIHKLIKDAITFYNNGNTNAAANNAFNLAVWQSQQAQFSSVLQEQLNNLFSDKTFPLYIPAGRSLLATLSEHFRLSPDITLDRLLKDFIERISLLKTQFSQRLDEIVEDKKRLSSGKINFMYVKKAINIIKQILKGDYVCDKEGEKIYFNEDEYVKLSFSSSGQQESLWILLLLFSIILDNYSVFLIVEEPEAHLFPEAQKYMMELIVLMANATNSQVIITTHSPYILTSANLLIHSASIENKISSEEMVVDKEKRLDRDNVGAYMLTKNGNFAYRNIIDEETGLIEAREIDSVSNIINKQTEDLIDLEVKYG
jgi:predicted ATPase